MQLARKIVETNFVRITTFLKNELFDNSMFQVRKSAILHNRQIIQSMDLHYVRRNQLRMCDLRSSCHHILDTVTDEAELIVDAVRLTFNVVEFVSSSICNMKRCQL